MGPTYEKHREANALAAISRSLRQDAGRQKAARDAPPEVTATGPAAANAGGSPPKKRRRSSATRETAASENDHAVHLPDEETSSGTSGGSASTDSQGNPPALPPVEQLAQQATEEPEDARFRQWYLASMASCFDQEIEALHEAGTAPPAGVLLRALSAGAALLTPAERHIAAAIAELPG